MRILGVGMMLGRSLGEEVVGRERRVELRQ